MEQVLLTSTTGYTANQIGGCTIHSALCLALKCKYKKLSSQALQKYQDMFKNVVGLIIDEFSMLCSRYLHCINMRLQEIMCNTKPFGGICIMLSGDPGQLPPVNGLCMWESPTTNTSYRNECLVGFELFNSITDVVHLNKNLRLDRDDVDAI